MLRHLILAPLLLVGCQTVTPTEPLPHTRVTEKSFRVDAAGERTPAPGELATSVLWVGDEQVAYQQGHFEFVLDRSLGRFLVLNHRDHTWVERELDELGQPLGELRSEELRALHARTRGGGEVTLTDNQREVNGKPCREYAVETWTETDSGARSVNHISVWTTEDVELDYTLVEAMLVPVRAIYGRDPGYIEELGGIRGVQMLVELTPPGASRARWVTEVREIVQLMPPKGTYGVPPGYQLHDWVELADF